MTREISDGIGHVRSSGFLRALIPLFAFADFTFAGATFTIVVACARPVTRRASSAWLKGSSP